MNSSFTTGARMRQTHGVDERRFSEDEARAIGQAIGIDWTASPFDVSQFGAGLDVEREHGRQVPRPT
jgi:hypothetical protein